MRYYKKAISTPGIPYYTYDEMQQDIEALQAEYPAFLQSRSLGKSVEGREITEVMLGAIDSRFHVLVQASMHAREYMNSILAMNQIEDYLQERSGKGRAHSQNYFNDQHTSFCSTDCLDSAEADRKFCMEKKKWEDICFHVIPMANPDGVTLCQNIEIALKNPLVRSLIEREAASRCQSGEPLNMDRFMEKRSLEYIHQWKANARGVDLNRNFDIGWEHYIGATEPCAEGYKGPFPASEPETQAILRVAKEYELTGCIAYHSSGNLIYWDYGCQGEMRTREAAFAASIAVATGYPLHSTIADAADSAGCSDYFVLKLGIPAVTIENGEMDCPLKSEEYEAIYKRNKNLWYGLR